MNDPDDIVARLDTEKMTQAFYKAFPTVVTLEDAMRQALAAADGIERLRADRDRWAKWGEHVFTCPNRGINPCRDCVSPATADAMNRVDQGGAWCTTPTV